MPMTRATLTAALASVATEVGRELRLDENDAIGLVVDGAEVVVEWIEASRCVAVHTVMPIPVSLTGAELALQLMMAHLAGASTHGCTFWLAPDETVRAGALVLGPTCGRDELVEAIARVTCVASGLPTPSA